MHAGVDLGRERVGRVPGQHLLFLLVVRDVEFGYRGRGAVGQALEDDPEAP